MEKKPPAGDTPGQMLAKMSTVSGLLTSPVIVGLLLDWQLGTTPWCILGGIAFGFAACMAYLIQQAKKG